MKDKEYYKMREFEYWMNTISEQMAAIATMANGINDELRKIREETAKLEILIQDTEHMTKWIESEADDE